MGTGGVHQAPARRTLLLLRQHASGCQRTVTWRMPFNPLPCRRVQGVCRPVLSQSEAGAGPAGGLPDQSGVNVGRWGFAFGN